MKRPRAAAGRPSTPAAAEGDRIGGHLRALRAERGMTLDRLSHATGLTKSYLSKIQNARKLPPIATLSRIAQALGVGIGHFFTAASGGGRAAVSVVRKGERPPLVRGGTAFGYDYVGLARLGGAHSLEPFIFTFPSRIDRHVFFEHEGEEFLFVLGGRVALQVGDERFTLEEGDSIHFDARLPHRGWSLGRDARALVVVNVAAPEAAEMPAAKRSRRAPLRKSR